MEAVFATVAGLDSKASLEVMAKLNGAPLSGYFSPPVCHAVHLCLRSGHLTTRRVIGGFGIPDYAVYSCPLVLVMLDSRGNIFILSAMLSALLMGTGILVADTCSGFTINQAVVDCDKGPAEACALEA